MEREFAKSRQNETFSSRDLKEYNSTQIRGRSMGHHEYRGNHRSSNRGKGIQAFDRNNWMKNVI